MEELQWHREPFYFTLECADHKKRILSSKSYLSQVRSCFLAFKLPLGAHCDPATLFSCLDHSVPRYLHQKFPPLLLSHVLDACQLGILSQAFPHLLQRHCHVTYKRLYDFLRHPPLQALQDALETISAKAQFDGKELPVFTRVAESYGYIYLDLGDSMWQAVEVRPSGWSIVSELPVRFRRSKGMMALPKPEHGGSISSLRRFVNVKEDDWVLFVSWLIAAFRPKGPYPILGLKGEQGSAKTTIGRVARQLIDPFMIDPFKAPMRTKPPNERDLMITASNSYLITLDNLSHLSPWLSDALCRLATGGGLATRQLYTDDEEIIFDAQRPTLLNGIEKEASDIALESSPVATAVYEFMRDKNKWEGTFGDLLGSLNSRVNNGSRTGRSLPISARALECADASQSQPKKCRYHVGSSAT